LELAGSKSSPLRRLSTVMYPKTCGSHARKVRDPAFYRPGFHIYNLNMCSRKSVGSPSSACEARALRRSPAAFSGCAKLHPNRCEYKERNHPYFANNTHIIWCVKYAAASMRSLLHLTPARPGLAPELGQKGPIPVCNLFEDC
jgi:hypothetical protein